MANSIVEPGGMTDRVVTLQRWLLFAAGFLVLSLVSALVGVSVGREEKAWSFVSLAAFATGFVLGIPVLLRIRQVLRAHALVLEGAHDGVFEWNPVTKRLRVGKRLLAILGYSEDFLDDTQTWLGIVHPEDRARYNQAVSAHLKGVTDHFYCEYRVRASDGAYRWLAARGMAVRNAKGVATQMAGSVSDITERVEREQRIRDLAVIDQLTGLPNRRGLMERLPGALAAARRSGQMLAVLFIDLDRFKNVNDARGHLFGDALLVGITARLPAALRAYDVLLRHGGDEFVVLLTGLADRLEVENVSRRLLSLIEEPISIEGIEMRVSASIGIGLYPDNGVDTDALLRCADIAMYEAKAAGGNEVRFFENRMKVRVSERAAMEQRLRVAIENGDLCLHFQPQQDFATGRVCGAEALVRWQDGERMVRPDEFIPLSEETGLIEPLGQWVMDAAIGRLARWQGTCPDGFRVSINLSARQFMKRAVEHDLFAASARHGVAAHLIELEVTESVLLNPEGAALRALQSMREAGCLIALDDFGTGYSSLSYLQLVEFDALKIDKSFISGVDTRFIERSARNGAAIVNAMIVLGHQLGYRIVAEGVETQDQYDWLKRIGCDLCQGYFFSRPLPAAEFERRFLSVAALREEVA